MREVVKFIATAQGQIACGTARRHRAEIKDRWWSLITNIFCVEAVRQFVAFEMFTINRDIFYAEADSLTVLLSDTNIDRQRSKDSLLQLR